MSQNITLNYDHTHAGVQLKAGAVITVDDASADWLVDNGIGVKVSTSTFDNPTVDTIDPTPDTK